MKDKELFAQLLGLVPPWEIADMKVDYDTLQIHIWISYPKGEKALCPECGKPCPVYDHREERHWRHLDTMQFKTVIHCKIPRIECPLHGAKSISVPWADARYHFTLLFERFATDILLGCQNQTKAGAILGLSWDETHEIQGRAVSRGLSRREDGPISYVGIDEKDFLKGHSYATLLVDIERSRVLEVTRGRDEIAATEVLEALPSKLRPSIKAVVIDMWEPYINVVEKVLPDSDIVHDKFHIAKHMNEAVDKVRKVENRMLLKGGDYTLRGTKYLWLSNSANLREAQRDAFCRLKREKLKTGRAQSWKETLATHSQLKPVIAVAKMLAKHIDNILTYLKHRVTNAVSEGINSKIQQIKSVAHALRNFNNYRTAILFYCGRLDMYPQESR